MSLDCVECVDGDVKDFHWVCITPRKKVHLRFRDDVVYHSSEPAGAMKGIMFMLWAIRNILSECHGNREPIPSQSSEYMTHTS